jgi:hypothetical protein
VPESLGDAVDVDGRIGGSHGKSGLVSDLDRLSGPKAVGMIGGG